MVRYWSCDKGCKAPTNIYHNNLEILLNMRNKSTFKEDVQ